MGYRQNLLETMTRTELRDILSQTVRPSTTGRKLASTKQLRKMAWGELDRRKLNPQLRGGR